MNIIEAEKEKKMKRIITALLCLSMLTLLLVGCTDNEQQQTPDTPCTHSYTNGKCIHCNADDPSYNAGGEDVEDEENKEESGDNTIPDVPSIDLGGEDELPFVPAS